MMYNRYIPSSNGTYKKQSVHIPDTDHVSESSPCVLPAEEEKPCEQKKNTSQRSGFDIGDLLLLCIVVLLLLDSDEEEMLPIILAVAAFMFLP